MPTRLLSVLSGLLLAGCSSAWTPDDADGDGFTALQGDCWDAAEGPEGSGLGGADIHPGASETWYDGVDQDCAVDDDFDADADGFVPSDHEGRTTAGVPETGSLPGGDCWDDPASVPAEYAVVPSSFSDKAGTSLAWAQPAASEVHPEATDTWYDGVDQDCAADDDFDRDLDGWRTEAYPDATGTYGDDCVDGAPLDDENPAGTASDGIHPGASETWYDGTDQDCDDNDCDADGDGFDGGDGTWCVSNECDDTDPEIYPDPDIPEVWYNGRDENCDGNDGDQDGDGFWAADYEALVEAAGGTPMAIPDGSEGDCWDVPSSVGGIPSDYEAINGFPQADAVDVHPAAMETWYDDVDQDCSATSDFDQDADGHDTDAWADRDGVWGLDCDDARSGVNPDATESWYDGTDDDCDGNDGDRDGDGYWAADYDSLVVASGGTPLDVPEGFEGDCNDENAAVHPNRDEDCATSGVDDDCSGSDNDEDATGCTDWYWDGDADDHGDASIEPTCFCVPTSDWTALEGDDCDDDDDSVYPGATEIVGNGVDEDCDDGEICYDDAD
ncbi:MAG: putative metal-binding motif-containing protein, partial [Deltaproteobacteria bacterium]|nr:putative metal-binding motif-containing protein [Deltaproteobacteria bacterium]